MVGEVDRGARVIEGIVCIGVKEILGDHAGCHGMMWDEFICWIA